MQGHISIDLEVSDPYVAQDIVDTLEKILPYMADNVSVQSTFEANDPTPCCPDPECPGRRGSECTFPGYVDEVSPLKSNKPQERRG